MNDLYRKFSGANMDIDLATADEKISWKQDKCPWNLAEQTNLHRCAVKNVSLCHYFRGVEFPDILLCCFPDRESSKE